MSQQRHVILRKGEAPSRGTTRGGPVAGPAAVATAAPIAVEVEELAPARARAVAKTKDGMPQTQQIHLADRQISY